MSIDYYHGLLADEIRIRAFQKAIGATVTPKDTVLEIGTGLGTFSLFAAEAGAKHVYAVDGDPVVHVAEALARQNGHSDRMTCIRGWVPEVDLPTPVTVLIFEDFVTSLLDTQTYRMLRDATLKYLAAGARMIPEKATVYVAPISSDDVRQRLFPLESVADRYGIEWDESHSYLQNCPRQDRLPIGVLAGEAKPLYEVHFPALPEPNAMGGKLEWNAGAGSVIHGLALWFDMDLGGAGGGLTNGPGDETGPWGQMILPLDPPVVVDSSGSFIATLRIDATKDGAPGWMGWSARSGESSAGGHEFAGAPAALEDLVSASETHTRRPDVSDGPDRPRKSDGPRSSQELADVRL